MLERRPISDSLRGYVTHVADRHYALALNDPSPAPILHEGRFVIRYAIPYLGKPQYAIVPELVALDYGELLNGEEAWHFLLKRSNLYPRADVLGHRNDGEDEQITVKMLDLALPIQVYVYEDEASWKPLCRLAAFIAAEAADAPQRLREYVPHFTSYEAWRRAVAAP